MSIRNKKIEQPFDFWCFGLIAIFVLNKECSSPQALVACFSCFFFTRICSHPLQDSYLWENMDPVAFLPPESQDMVKIVNSYNHIMMKKDLSLLPDPCSFRGNIGEFISCQVMQVNRSFYWSNSTVDVRSITEGSKGTEKFTCGIIFLSNLASVHATTTNCYHSILGDVLCSIENDKHTFSQGVLVSPVQPASCVLRNNACFIFILETTVHQQKNHGGNKVESFKEVLTFEFLFEAVEVLFPPTFVNFHRMAVTYKKYLSSFFYNLHEVFPETSFEGFSVFLLKQAESLSTGNLFLCNSGTYISHQFLCDAHKDCPGNDPGDEVGCECIEAHAYSVRCKFISTTKHLKECSDFYIQRKNGLCQITSEIVNDDDKTVNKSIQQQLSCRSGQPKVYSVSDICKFELNLNLSLIPCQFGEHLQTCREFECSMMFKCPGSYCVPWRYVCDGKRDCPEGYDEHQVCKVERICKDMFKCRLHTICIHIGDVCNNFQDCPAGDDEIHCLVKGTSCPKYCQCLTFVLRCVAEKEPRHLIFHGKLHYFVVVITNSKIVLDTGFSDTFRPVLQLTITNAGVQEICFVLSRMESILLLNVNVNSIVHVSSKCFWKTPQVKIVILSKNAILEVKRTAFLNQQSLYHLDLSNNFLTCFSSQNTLHIKFLALAKNPLENILVSSFDKLYVQVVHTEDYRICCLFSSNSVCANKVKWYNICLGLLHNAFLSVICIVLSILVVCVNVASLLLQNISRWKQRSTNSYKIHISFINTVDMTLGMYLFLLSTMNFFHQNKFFLVEYQWKCSTLCSVMHYIILHFNLASPVLLVFLATSRLMIVQDPLASLTRSLVLRNMSLVVAMASCVSLCVTFVTWKLNFCATVSLCTPYFDHSQSSSVARVVTWVSIVEEVSASVSIPAIYLSLFLSLKESEMRMREAIAKQHSTKAGQVQMLILVTANLLCWVPSVVILLVSLLERQYPLSLGQWMLVTVVPLNPVVNSCVFTVTSVRSLLLEKKRTEKARMHLQLPK